MTVEKELETVKHNLNCLNAECEYEKALASLSDIMVYEYQQYKQLDPNYSLFIQFKNAILPRLQTERQIMEAA